MNSLHLHLRKSLGWYNNWHDDRLHHHAHWALFLVITTLLTSFISQGMRDFYFENEYRAEAATIGNVATIDLGVGTFPDPAFYNGRIWIAVQQGPPGDYGILNLYNFAPDLSDQKVQQIPFSGLGRAFQRLAVSNNILWMIFRDGDNSQPVVVPEHIKLWRSDTGAIEDLGYVVNSGNHPVAIGNGYIVWQNQLQPGEIQKVHRRQIASGLITVIGDGAPTGISRILPSGDVVLMDTDLTAVPWGVQAWFAYPLVVATDAYNLPPNILPGNDNGVIGRFNDDPATQFNIWPTERAHTPHAVGDGQGNYVITTWNPTVRVAAGTFSQPPIITGINPDTITAGDTLEIFGSFLSPVVQFFDVTGTPTNILGWIDQNTGIVSLVIPTTLLPGIYTVGIVGPGGSAISPQILTILEDASQVQAAAAPIDTPPATPFQSLITSAYNYSLILVGMAVFIMILWGGFLWLTSAANPGNISVAKSRITNALIGAVLLVASYVILNTINPELVGGRFNLPGLQAPPPLPPPPSGSNSQTAAQNLISIIGLGSFSTNASCGGNYHARQNIQDMAAGGAPAVCTANTCTPCIAGGTSGTVYVWPAILDGLAALWNSGSRFTVTSFTTGNHSVGSRHYQGRAVDIVINSSNASVWQTALDYLITNYNGNIFCETTTGSSDTSCTPVSAGGNTDHIHWDL